MKLGEISVPDAALSCKGNLTESDSVENDDDIHQRPLVSDCDVTFRGNSSLILDIDDINGNEFGDYICHTGNMRSENLTIHLRGSFLNTVFCFTTTKQQMNGNNEEYPFYLYFSRDCSFVQEK